MQTITPFLWYDGQAEEAATFYTSIFKDSKMLSVSPMAATFELQGQKFIALNGGPDYSFTPAVSFLIECETQQEVDDLWDRLSEGGEPGRCGWLKDKFGLSWQVIPSILPQMLQDDDDEKSGRVMQAMLGMSKIDIAGLRRAYEPVSP
jgi:predicted 3-demethylubiquinone-9 3-methyltransferase (glyoxalase superfamily)